MNNARTDMTTQVKTTNINKMLTKRLNKTIALAIELGKERDQLRKGLLLSLLLSVKWTREKELQFDRKNVWKVKIGIGSIPTTEVCKHETFGYDSAQHEKTSKTHVFVWTRTANESGFVYVCSDVSSETKVRTTLQRHLEDL